MGKIASVLVGFVATPCIVVAGLIAAPDLKLSDLDVPATDVLLAKPGDGAFSHIPLLVPFSSLRLLRGTDDALFAIGGSVTDERFDPTTNTMVSSHQNIGWSPDAPMDCPVDGQALFLGRGRWLASARPTDGAQTLRTALYDGKWNDGPLLPTSALAQSAAILADKTIALVVHDRGLYLAAPADPQFHAVELDAKLPDGELYAFGGGLLLVTTSPTKPASITTRVIDLTSHRVIPGPAETYPVNDTIHVSMGPTPSGVLIGVQRTTHKYDPRGLWLNVFFGLICAVELAGFTFYLDRVRRAQGTAAWGWVGLGVGLSVALFGGAAALFVLILKGARYN